MADDDEEWRFSVDEVGPDDADDEAATADGDATAGGDATSDEWVTMVGEDDDAPTVGVATGDPEEAEDGTGNVAGTLAPDASVEPGTPGLENAAFATAGAILTALVFAGVLLPLDAVTAGAIAGAIAATAGILYLFFRRF